jgi:phage FluMu protein Com
MASRSPVADPPAEPAIETPSSWEATRCRSCQRLLCKNTRDALRPECIIEIKCGDCKTLNYLMGRPA